MAAPRTPTLTEDVSSSAALPLALTEVEIKSCSLELLPTELLLNIMGYLSTLDLLAMREVGRIFSEVIDNSTLLRTIDLHQCYSVTPHTLWELGHLDVVPSIQSFNISNCYWLTGSQFSLLNPKMPSLKYLDIRGTDVPMKTLDKILSSAQTLKSLSYSHSAPFGKAATETLSQLVELNMVISHRCDFTFLRHCKSLRAFTLDINQQIEASHSAYVYELIQLIFLELPLSRLHYLDFLRVPQKPLPSYCSSGLRFPSEEKAPSHPGCVSDSRGPGLSKILSVELDSSDDFHLSSRFSSVRHLNVSGTSFTKRELCSAGENFSQLRSLNISGCQNILMTEGDKNLDLSFLEALVEAKVPLEHLNISGLHLHHPDDDNRLTQLLGQLHGLKTLSLPFCCLADNTKSEPMWMSSSRRNRTDNTRSQQDTQGSTSKRQRLGIRVSEHSRCESCMNETTSPVDAKNKNLSCLGVDWKSGDYQVLIRTSSLLLFIFCHGVNFEGCIYCGSHLARVVNGDRQLQSLELVGVAFKSVLGMDSLFKSLSTLKQASFSQCDPSTFLSVSEDALLCISRLTHLRSLVLAGIPTILHGHSLVEILKNCKQLRSLSLANLGPSAQCQFLKGLVEGLKHADHLEDLRLEHQYIDQMNSLFQAVHHCPSLTRLCIISKGTQVEPQDVLMIFNRCRKLILLCLMCSLTVKGCKDLAKEIKARYSLSRPALRVAFGSYPIFKDKLAEFLKKIPRVHLKEFVLHESRVATTPPSWPELEKMIRDEEESDSR